MSKLQDIKTAQLNARKNKVASVASLLTTVIGEAEMVGKNANREVTEAEVIQVLKRFEKGMTETLRFLIVAGRDNQDKIAMIEGELKIIRTFLPEKISDGQVLDDIRSIIGAEGLALEQKSLGVITKLLRGKYGEQFDGQQVSTQFKSILIRGGI